jgi:hypothetical protein
MLGIDILRHILSIFVILQHMGSSRYSANINGELRYYVDFVDGAVACFFMISGFFSKAQPNFCVFVKSQVVRLLVPFFIFSSAYGVLLYLLGKDSIYAGIYSTVTFRGAGMQLYFLPYLLGISVFFAAIRSVSGELVYPRILAAMAVFFILMCVAFPTLGSTGPDYRLLPYYFLAYIAGFLYRSIGRGFYVWFVLIVTLVLGLLDHRFLDLSGMIVLFVCAESWSSKFGSGRAVGSGGVYLLHTPILNFSISIFLEKLGVLQFYNVILSVALTYVVCLFISIVFIKFLPRYRWLILE